MSLRTLTRLGGFALGLLLAAPLLWQVVGPWSLLLGPGLLGLASGYLALASGRRRASRWQLRYQMEARQANERLDATLGFLADKARHLVIEGDHQGLFLEAPAAFDRYVQAQLERALPQARVVQSSNNNNRQQQHGGTLYLALDPRPHEALHWATEQPGRQVRLHIRRGPCVTLVARTDNGSRLPGDWLRIPAPEGLAARFWGTLPVWDELSAGGKLGHLLPTTGDGSAYSSRSRLLQLTLPGGYAGGDRHLGDSADGQPLSLGHSVPLFTAGAPASFLARQVAGDLERGRAVVVVSPHRRVLNLVQRQAQAMTYWLDQENSRLSAHLAVVSAGEWNERAPRVATIVDIAERFLTDLGIDLQLPIVRTLVGHLVRILAASARATGHDFAFTDLYAISQSPQALKAFLSDLSGLLDGMDPQTRNSVGFLLDMLEQDLGYVQVVTVLSLVRTALSPVCAGALHVLCQPPFLHASQALGSSSLFLVPMTNADFPEHNRFLGALLDFTLRQVLATAGDTLRLTLCLHDPHVYYADGGQHWIQVARNDSRLSLLLDVQDPNRYLQVSPQAGSEAELVFRCDEALASALIGDWGLDCTVAELTEIPDGTALARLPGLPGPVTLKTGGGS